MMDDVHLPSHAYVPGMTDRHPEGAFEDICETAKPGMTVAALIACPAFRHGLAYLDRGFNWEAHEVLEPVWMALPKGAPERAFVQALIQLANAALKARMGRRKAVQRLCAIVQDHLDRAGDDVVVGGVSSADIRSRVGRLESLAGIAI